MRWWQVLLVIVAWDCIRLFLQAVVNKWWLRLGKTEIQGRSKNEKRSIV